MAPTLILQLLRNREPFSTARLRPPSPGHKCQGYEQRPLKGTSSRIHPAPYPSPGIYARAGPAVTTELSKYPPRDAGPQPAPLALLLLRHPLLLQNVPHLLRRHRDLDVPHSEVRQRVDDGIDDPGRVAHAGGLADSFGSQRMVRAGRHRLAGLPTGRLHGGGDEVVHEA